MLITKRFIKNTALFICCAGFLTSCEPEDTTPPIGTTIENITGKWSCSETSQQFGSSTYEVEISQSASSSTQVRIKNFYQLPGASVNVNVNGNSLTIPTQTVQSFVFSGSGTIVNQNRINLTYTADDGGGVLDQVSAGLSK
jgi:hypothetical protein